MQPSDKLDVDSWGVHKAAAVALTKMAEVTTDIVEPILKFGQTNIHSTEWREREAVFISMGSLLRGASQAISQSVTADLLREALHAAAAEDNEEVLRDSAMWAIGV